MLPPLPASFIPEKEFPILNHYTFFNHAGVAPIAARAADAIRIPLEDIPNAITPNTRMIALSHVEYASGFRHDLKTIGEFCSTRKNSRGEKILLCIDAIQSVGIVPVDVRSMHIDFLSADG